MRRQLIRHGQRVETLPLKGLTVSIKIIGIVDDKTKIFISARIQI